MKLCRFALPSSPDVVRSGIVYGGKIYETDGANPVAVHDPVSAQLLAPVGHPGSVRLFEAHRPAFAEWVAGEDSRTAPADFAYLNPAIIAGPNARVRSFSPSKQIGIKLCVAAVVGDAGHAIGIEEAESRILGFALGALFFASDIEREEMARGVGISRSHDAGLAVGPALTTPDELEDIAEHTESGLRFAIEAALVLNGEEQARTSLSDAPWTFGEIVCRASESCPLAPGDMFVAALTTMRADEAVEPGTAVVVRSERLGNLAVQYG
jgi:2-keto-4-pentenoate hydratase/2-oxohepta-3-ene-1,7-dioic acid hydratase in catechol pathway